MQLKVSILGSLEVRDGDDAVVPVGGARLRALLIRLALDAGRSVSVGSLVDALWNEEPPDGAANALQSLVSRLRRALGDPDLVTAVPGGYSLAVPASAVDANRFEALTREGRDALRSGDAEAARRRLREALSLWHGPALADVADAPFAASRATRLDDLRLAAVRDRIDADLRLGRHGEAAPELEALAVEYPLREDLAALLVRALYAAGRQADALAAYARIRDALSDQLGIDPSRELAEVHLAVLRNDPALAPAPVVGTPGPALTPERAATPAMSAASAATTSAAATAPPPGPADRTETGAARNAAPPPLPRHSNLRSSLTSFVGRVEEVARIAKLLETSRLVTLVGPGGAGKTRLAGEAAARMLEQGPDADRVPDGAWLVELAPVTDPAEVAQAVLTALGPRVTRVIGRDQQPAQARDTHTRLTELLADKTLVVILDNCEHLLDAAAGVAEYLLGSCPGLRMIATSREPLGILGENVLPVPPLGQPPGECPVVDALAFPAIRLFADRAAAVQPDFALSEANVADVVQICRRLDGLPLAIELAAARLRALPVRLVAARLDDRFRLLTGGSRTAMPRHQTLRAVVAWSWELLEDAERTLAERLSVFPGGVRADSAAAVHPASSDEIYDLLSALVDKSLLQPAGAGPDGEPRYRMLETIREYGAERLAEAGTLAEVRRAHALHFRDLAEEAEPHLRRREQLVWLARLGEERDNILAALHVAIDASDAETAVRIAAALTSYWVLGGQHAEGMDWLGAVIAVPGDAPPEPYAICRIYHAVTSLFNGQQWTDMSGIRAELDAALAGPAADSTHPMITLARLLVPMMENNLAEVDSTMRRIVDGADPWAVASLHMMRGLSAENDGDLATQRADLAEARARFEALGERWGLAATLSGLAALAITDGDTAGGLRLHDEALALMREINAGDDAVQTQVVRAMLTARLGDPRAARAMLEEVLESGRRSGSGSSVYMARYGLAELARITGDIEGAWAQLRAADEGEPWHGPPQIHAARGICGGLLHLADGEIEAARGCLAEALRQARIAVDMPVLARVAIAVGCYVAERGDAPLAARVLGVAAAMRGADDLGDEDRLRLVARLRALLGDAAFDDACEAGRALPREQGTALLARIVEPAEPAGPAEP